MDMREKNNIYVGEFSDKESLSLQVSSVRCNWWSLGEA
jgi:hypothetical protein